jgi:hypothetical protein
MNLCLALINIIVINNQDNKIMLCRGGRLGFFHAFAIPSTKPTKGVGARRKYERENI